MGNEEKITQESKNFIIAVIKEYKKMGPEATKINIEIGTTRKIHIDNANKVINVRVIGQREADALNAMQKSIISKMQDSSQAKNEEEEKDPALEWEELLIAHEKQKEKERMFALLDLYDEVEMSKKKKETVKHKDKSLKRTLNNGYKHLKNKVYKLSSKTKEKAEKAREYLSKNGKKVISLIAALALTIGVAYYTIDTTLDGYKTFNEYGSVQAIEQRMEDLLADEFKKSLNNDNLELVLHIIDMGEGDPSMLKIEIIDPNDPNYNMTFVLNDMLEVKNPRYITKMAQNYIKVNECENNKAAGTIAGSLLNKSEELAEENDIIIKDNGAADGTNMDRVPERNTKEGIEER